MKKAIPVGVMVILVLSSCVTSKEIVEDTAEWNYVENWKDYIVSDAKITVDGSIDDWKTVPVRDVSFIGAKVNEVLVKHPGTLIKIVGMARDEEYLYILLGFENGIPDGKMKLDYAVNLEVPGKGKEHQIHLKLQGWADDYPALFIFTPEEQDPQLARKWEAGSKRDMAMTGNYIETRYPIPIIEKYIDLEGQGTFEANFGVWSSEEPWPGHSCMLMSFIFH